MAVQLSLLLANTARFDFPARAPDMLEQLLVASQWPPTNDPPGPKVGAAADVHDCSRRQGTRSHPRVTACSVQHMKVPWIAELIVVCV